MPILCRVCRVRRTKQDSQIADLFLYEGGNRSGRDSLHGRSDAILANREGGYEKLERTVRRENSDGQR